ncbi:MAG: sigma-70 family RNA polymerase sigma factor [Planctomycetota bacterium]
MTDALPDPSDSSESVLHARELSALLSQHRDRLKRMVELRMDRRLQGRVDPSDVIQEAFVEASMRYAEYNRKREVTPSIWLRFLTGQKIVQAHRQHLGVQARDAGREISIYRGGVPEATTHALAAHLVGRHSSPTQAAAKAELKLRLEQALNQMEEIDREILALKHFEQLTTRELSALLNISQEAAYKRYVRALKRLKAVMQDAESDVRTLIP